MSASGRPDNPADTPQSWTQSGSRGRPAPVGDRFNSARRAPTPLNQTSSNSVGSDPFGYSLATTAGASTAPSAPRATPQNCAPSGSANSDSLGYHNSSSHSASNTTVPAASNASHDAAYALPQYQDEKVQFEHDANNDFMKNLIDDRDQYMQKAETLEVQNEALEVQLSEGKARRLAYQPYSADTSSSRVEVRCGRSKVPAPTGSENPRDEDAFRALKALYDEKVRTLKTQHEEEVQTLKDLNDEKIRTLEAEHEEKEALHYEEVRALKEKVRTLKAQQDEAIKAQEGNRPGHGLANSGQSTQIPTNLQEIIDLTDDSDQPTGAEKAPRRRQSNEKSAIPEPGQGEFSPVANPQEYVQKLAGERLNALLSVRPSDSSFSRPAFQYSFGKRTAPLGPGSPTTTDFDARGIKRKAIADEDAPESSQPDVSEANSKARRLVRNQQASRLRSNVQPVEDENDDLSIVVDSPEHEPQPGSANRRVLPAAPRNVGVKISKTSLEHEDLPDWLPTEVGQSLLAQFKSWNDKKPGWHTIQESFPDKCFTRKLRKLGTNAVEGNVACENCELTGKVCVRYEGAGTVAIVPLRDLVRKGTREDESFWMK